MSAKRATKFASTALQMFPPYRWGDEQEQNWSEHVIREISGFHDNVIERAEKEMLRTRKPKGGRDQPTTPAISECIAYCNEAQRWFDAEKNKGMLPLEPSSSHMDHTAERLKFANELSSNPSDPVCIEAAKNGWNGILRDFCRKHGRMPDKTKRIEYRKNKHSDPVLVDEIEWCKRETRDFDGALETCDLGFETVGSPGKGDTWIPLGAGVDKALANLGRSMLAKREEMADRVLRKVR